LRLQKTLQKALPGLVALALILAVFVFLSGKRTLSGNPVGPIPLELPETLGSYHGERLWFCQNEQCGRSFRESELSAPAAATNAAPDTATNAAPVAAKAAAQAVCPSCGAALSLISIGEVKLLPVNTPIFRKEYSTGGLGGGRNGIVATVVFSGLERRSIHRPQLCLVAQGNRITNEYPREFDLGGGKKTTLRILEIQQSYDGGKVVMNGIYAYWLFNPERETDSHLKRFLWMSLDNALRDYRPRWGYASISLFRDPGDPDAWKIQLGEFLRGFYPLIQQTRAGLEAQRNQTLTLEGRSGDLNFNTITNAPVTGKKRSF
jgi:hypothetical protein